MEEPTGIWVRGMDGETVAMTFPAFVAAMEESAIRPDDIIWSRIVTDSHWVRAGDMRLFQLLAEERRIVQEHATQEWPPPPVR